MPRQLGGAGLAWDTLERLFSLGAQLDGFPGRSKLPLLLICPATPLFLQHQQHQFVLQQTPCSPCNAILLESALPTVSLLPPSVVALLVYFPFMSFILLYGKQFTGRLSVLGVGWITLWWALA